MLWKNLPDSRVAVERAPVNLGVMISQVLQIMEVFLFWWAMYV
jgi:hypothetical protein